jgi:hypothetical protein
MSTERKSLFVFMHDHPAKLEDDSNCARQWRLSAAAESLVDRSVEPPTMTLIGFIGREMGGCLVSACEDRSHRHRRHRTR